MLTVQMCNVRSHFHSDCYPLQVCPAAVPIRGWNDMQLMPFFKWVKLKAALADYTSRPSMEDCKVIAKRLDIDVAKVRDGLFCCLHTVSGMRLSEPMSSSNGTLAAFEDVSQKRYPRSLTIICAPATPMLY